MRSRVLLASDGFVRKYTAYGKSKWRTARLCACGQLVTSHNVRSRAFSELYATNYYKQLMFNQYLSHEYMLLSLKRRENRITHTRRRTRRNVDSMEKSSDSTALAANRAFWTLSFRCSKTDGAVIIIILRRGALNVYDYYIDIVIIINNGGDVTVYFAYSFKHPCVWLTTYVYIIMFV